MREACARLLTALALCGAVGGAAGPAAAETGGAREQAGRAVVETEGHRRLVRVMDGAGHRPAPFVTDGCSGGLSATWRGLADRLPRFAGIHAERPPWEACCVTHDRAYHAAGGARTARESHAARRAADIALRACVRETGARRTAGLSAAYGVPASRIADAYEVIADAMFAAVRLGGAPCSGLPWRWGYGYPPCLGPHARAAAGDRP